MEIEKTDLIAQNTSSGCVKKGHDKNEADLYSIVSQKAQENSRGTLRRKNQEIEWVNLTKALKSLLKESKQSLTPALYAEAEKLSSLLEDDKGKAIFLDYSGMEGDATTLSRKEFNRLLCEQVTTKKSPLKGKQSKGKKNLKDVPPATRVPYHMIVKNLENQKGMMKDCIVGNILIDADINQVVSVVKNPQQAFGKGIIENSTRLGKHESRQFGFDEVYRIQNKPIKLGVGLLKVTVIEDSTENIGVNVTKNKDCTKVTFKSLPDSKHVLQGEWILKPAGNHKTSAQLVLNVDLKNNLVSDGKILNHINGRIGDGLRGVRNTAENNTSHNPFAMFSIFEKLKDKVISWRYDQEPCP